MIVITILIVTAVKLWPLYAPRAHPGQSCCWNISISLFCVKAERKVFSGKDPLYSTQKTKDWSFITS